MRGCSPVYACHASWIRIHLKTKFQLVIEEHDLSQSKARVDNPAVQNVMLRSWVTHQSR